MSRVQIFDLVRTFVEEGRDVKCPPFKNPLTSSLIDDRSANWRKCCAGTSAAPVDCPSATMQHTSALPTRRHQVPAPIDSRGLSFWCVRCLTFWSMRFLK